MAETKRAEIPNFTGGEAAAITQQGNPYIFRTSFTQTTAMPKVARYLKDTVKAKTVAMIWVNNDFGKGGRDTLHEGARARTASRSSPTSRPIRASSTSPAQCSRRSRRTPTRSSSTRNEEESARALRELRKQGYDKPIVGETVLTSQKVIELARRGGQRRSRARRAHRRRAAAGHQGVRPRNSRRNTSTRRDHNGAQGLQRRCTSSRW